MNKVFIFLFFICLSVYSQNDTMDELYSIKELEVVNLELFSVLDSIIQMRSKIQAYRETSFFTIEFNEDDNKKDLIFVRAYEKIDYNYPNILGYFGYKENYFIVMGDFINLSVFRKTSKSREFEFGLPEFEKINGEPFVDQFETFAVWSMRYKLGEFKVLSFYTDNILDCWFDNINDDYDKK